jgi:hypothetical protein
MSESLALRVETPARLGGLTRASVLTLALWLVVCAALLLALAPGVASSLAGPDDALRLVEVRRLLAGQSYFDMIEPRLGEHGYLTHWSRLVDLGLAGTVKLFETFAGPDRAELLTRVIWPLPFLAMIMLAQTAVAFRLGGERAAMLAALVGATCLPGFAHFAPGSIDHHHVQAALCALTIALMVYGLTDVRVAAGAGATVALTLGIGLESLAFLGIGASVIALAFVVDGDRGPQTRTFGLALAAAAIAVLFATVPPARWNVSVCDAYAVNTAVPIVLGGLGLAVATVFARYRVVVRLTATAAAGALALALYLAFDPACAGGPFAHVDPALRTLWLDHVTELRSIVALARQEPATALLVATFPVVATLCAICLLRRSRPPELVLAIAVFATACVVAVLMVRAEVYANWFAVPLVAAALDRLLERTRRLPLRVVLIVLALPMTSATVDLAVAQRFVGDGSRNAAGQAEKRAACFATNAYRALAQLPPGLVLSQLDIATYVLALTPHRVVMAPYHRLDRDLLFGLRLFAGPVETAEAQLRTARVDYIVDCPALELTSAGAEPNFRTALTSGKPPDYLQPVDAGAASPLLIFKVRR